MLYLPHRATKRAHSLLAHTRSNPLVKPAAESLFSWSDLCHCCLLSLTSSCRTSTVQRKTSSCWQKWQPVKFKFWWSLRKIFQVGPHVLTRTHPVRFSKGKNTLGTTQTLWEESLLRGDALITDDDNISRDPLLICMGKRFTRDGFEKSHSVVNATLLLLLLFWGMLFEIFNSNLQEATRIKSSCCCKVLKYF